ncbi:MAG: patatin-like phospholipase family protein [Acidobacteriota bacterium]
MPVDSRPVCIGLVLSAGGLRGAAHLGVLRRLVQHDIPVEVIVGVSAGAIIASYYAAVGLTADEMISNAPAFRGRHILMHGVTLRVHQSLKPYLRRFCGVIPQRLDQLEAATFTTLHHGIQRLGVVCHDLDRHEPRYFSTTDSHGVRLSDVARASAAIPGVMPPKVMTVAHNVVRLADGGLSDSLPVDFARSRALGATHLIASDCRYSAPNPPDAEEGLVYLRPNLDGIKPLRAPRAALMQAVERGEAAVTDAAIDRIRNWTLVPLASVLA